MIFETYQLDLATNAIDRCFPEGLYSTAFRMIETDVLAWHGCYPDSGAMTQEQLGAVLEPFSTAAVQTWVLDCIEHADCYEMTPQRCA